MDLNLKTVLLTMAATCALSACGPGRHTTQMPNEIVGGLTMFGDPTDDFEFPEFEDGSDLEGDMPGETIAHGDPQGRMPAAWDGNTPLAGKFTELTLHALDTVGAQILESVPTDIADFCPTYSSLDREGRKGVWLMIVSAMAKFESSFRPSTSFQEKFKNGKNEWVVSRGLLQLSSESANGFGCRIRQEAELQDPATNLSCAIRILTRTVTKDQVVTMHDERWHGGARYWSVLRKPKTLVPIKNVTRSLASCQES